MKITLHQPNGVSVTFTKCELIFREGCWVRFKGTNDLGREVVIATSLPVEIYIN